MQQADSTDMAAERLYAAFAGYRVRHAMEACPCCVTDDDQRRLLSKPLRDLSADDLDLYAYKAMTTWGTVADFKHFLPRLLELASNDTDAGLLDIVGLADKLCYGHWSEWPQDEREAVADWMAAVWNSLLQTYPSGILASDLLLAADELGLELHPFVDRLFEAGSLAAARHLAQVASSGAWWGSFSRKDVVRAKLYGAVISPRTLEALEAAFFDHAEEECATELAEAADMVRSELQQRTCSPAPDADRNGPIS